MIRTAFSLLLAVLLTSAGALAQTGKPDVKLGVEIGWGNPLRAGRWTPIFVTAADASTTEAKPRAVGISVEIEQGGTNVMQISQSAAIGPTPATFTILLPLSRETPVVKLHDLASGKTLASWPAEKDKDREDVSRRLLEGDMNFIGVSGAPTELPGLSYQADLQAEVGFLPPERLPTQPLGYDMLDLLILNRPNIHQIPPDAQAAIVEWVRGGGVLLLWPGSDPVPPGPLADALPCKIGIPRSYSFSPEQQSKSGLAKRFSGMAGYQLTPAGDADAIPLFADSAGKTDSIAYSKRVGFGRITVAPFDVSLLQFKATLNGADPGELPQPPPDTANEDSSENNNYQRVRSTRPRGPGREFFEQLTARMGLYELRHSDDSNSYRYRSYGSDPINGRQQQATSRLEDFLGDIPGAGRFGFAYVAWVMLGMMVLVGPVDWFVLRKLGRQPWTWVTTTGWIGLITVGALMIARVFKSGDLYFNTVELIDQADDRIVARNTLVGIYSPRSTEYHIDGPAAEGSAGNGPAAVAGWWSLPGSEEYSRSGLKIDTAFHQSIDGMEPLEMSINVWNLRFLHGQDFGGKQDPILSADLRMRRLSLTTGTTSTRSSIVGTITNLSPHTLIDVRVATSRQSALVATPTGDESADLAASPSISPPSGQKTGAMPDAAAIGRLKIVIPRLEPKQSVTVNIPLDDSARLPYGAPSNGYEYNSYYSRYGNQEVLAADRIWAFAGDLAARRTWRMGLETADGKTAVIFARIEKPVPSVSLREPNSKQKHEAAVRAVVKIRE